MLRVACVFLTIGLLVPISSGCQSARRAQVSQTPSTAFIPTGDGGSRSVELVSTDTSDREVRFASNRKASSSSNSDSSTFSSLLTGGGKRIPLPESNSSKLKQIDPPRQAAANSIGAF